MSDLGVKWFQPASPYIPRLNMPLTKIPKSSKMGQSGLNLLQH